MFGGFLCRGQAPHRSLVGHQNCGQFHLSAMAMHLCLSTRLTRNLDVVAILLCFSSVQHPSTWLLCQLIVTAVMHWQSPPLYLAYPATLCYCTCGGPRLGFSGAVGTELLVLVRGTVYDNVFNTVYAENMVFTARVFWWKSAGKVPSLVALGPEFWPRVLPKPGCAPGLARADGSATPQCADMG